ncbi:MAG TPA: PTS sugar transporter subunit IIA [Burkholderiaceae bacterium]|nr:PTS sugar transporter subunit IIA [Burkholderiaceae bacterium]HYB49509.1 PTS sugar transporter subunit IIA [Burkholderiaceae bacterium]
MQLAQFPRIATFVDQVAGVAQGLGQSRGGRPQHASNRIGSLLAVEDILLDVVSGNKMDLLDEIGQHIESVHDMARGSVAPALRHRERISSTALGQGVALPHARVAGLERILPMYLRLRFPITFDAPDESPVSDVFVLLVPKQATQEHLEILAQVSQMLSDRSFRERLHQCRQAQEAKSLFESWPALPST